MEENHPVVMIDTIVERLDLDPLYATYAKEGNPAYHPKMMLKILFYAYYCRIMSSRTIWRNVVHPSDFMFLAAGQVPNFRTINTFRLRHLENLPNLFAQIVLLCKKLEMIGFEHMAIDGEKIQANANFKNSKNIKQVKAEDLIPLVEQSVENTHEHHKDVTADSGFQSYSNLEKMEERPEEFYVPDKRHESAKKKEGCRRSGIEG